MEIEKIKRKSTKELEEMDCAALKEYYGALLQKMLQLRLHMSRGEGTAQYSFFKTILKKEIASLRQVWGRYYRSAVLDMVRTDIVDQSLKSNGKGRKEGEKKVAKEKMREKNEE